MRDRLIGDRYRLEERLGAGGMGEVWRATDQELGRQVALKRSQNGDDAQIRREARIGAGLQHPHVVTVYDAVVDDDGRWIIMEYLPSRSLAEILDTTGALPPSKVAGIGAQLADALAAMHAKGMVHRDIKPGNVLVTEDGTAKLTDLGIAQWSEVTHTGSGQVCGTPGYAAPEVADGHPARSASDVFSLGATLFAAVEGTSPWDGTDGPYAQLRRAAAFDFRPPRKAGALGPVLIELMRKHPATRPTAAQAKRLLAGDTAVRRRRRVVPRRVLLSIGAGALVLALVAGLAYGIGGTSAPTADTTGDPRTADPCALLDPAWLTSFGKVEFDRDFGNFNACSLLVNQTGDPADIVDVRAEIRTTDEPPPVPPAAGKLVMPDRPREEDGKCARTVALPDGNEIAVTAKHNSHWHARLCAMADQVTLNMLPILNSGQIPRRAAPLAAQSLASVDACGLLHDEDVNPLLGKKVPALPAFAAWECYWTQGFYEVAIVYDREKWPFSSDEGRLVRSGTHDIYVETGTGGWADSCQAELVHRRFTSAGREWVETVEIYLSYQDTSTPETLCDPVTKLAKAAASRLPSLG